MIIVPLSQETTPTVPVNVEVDSEAGEGTVTLAVPADVVYPDCRFRILLPEEARAIAAALLHFAKEAEL